MDNQTEAATPESLKQYIDGLKLKLVEIITRSREPIFVVNKDKVSAGFDLNGLMKQIKAGGIVLHAERIEEAENIIEEFDLRIDVESTIELIKTLREQQNVHYELMKTKLNKGE